MKFVYAALVGIATAIQLKAQQGWLEQQIDAAIEAENQAMRDDLEAEYGWLYETKNNGDYVWDEFEAAKMRAELDYEYGWLYEDWCAEDDEECIAERDAEGSDDEGEGSGSDDEQEGSGSDDDGEGSYGEGSDGEGEEAE